MARLSVRNSVTVVATFLFPLVATLAPKGTVVLLVVVGLIAIAISIREHRVSELLSRRGIALCAITVACLLYSAFNSVDPEGAIARLTKVISVMAFGIAIIWLYRTLDSAGRDQVLRACLVGSTISASLIVYGILAIEGEWPHPFPIDGRSDRLSALNSGLVCIGALFPACALYLWQQQVKLGSIVAGVSLFAVSVFSGTLAVTLGLVLAVSVVILLLFWKNSFNRKIVAAALVAMVLSTPWSAPPFLDLVESNISTRTEDGQVEKAAESLGSILHRYEIWRFVSERAIEKPIAGWGFNASRDIPGGDATFDIGKEKLPLHPHNGVLQIWLELGYVGLVILGLILWQSLQLRNDRFITTRGNAARGGTVVFLFATANVTFGIWQSWWLATIILCFAISCAWESSVTKNECIRDAR